MTFSLLCFNILILCPFAYAAIPTAPVDVTIFHQGPLLNITWKKPVHVGGQAIKKYVIHLSCVYQKHQKKDLSMNQVSVETGGEQLHYVASINKLACYRVRRGASLVLVRAGVETVNDFGNRSSISSAIFNMSECLEISSPITLGILAFSCSVAIHKPYLSPMIIAQWVYLES